MSKRFVVTGAAGFIGSHLAELLLGRGDEVVAIDSFTDYYDPALKRENAARLNVAEVDLADAPLERLLAAADGVFHLAAQPGVRSGWDDDFGLYVRHNISASQRLFAAAGPRGVPVVLTSSSSVYGDADAYPLHEELTPAPKSPYGVTKLAAEHLARAAEQAFGLHAVILRLFTVYGPRQRPDMAVSRIFHSLLGGSAFDVYEDGSQSRDLTFVGDAVRALVAAMDSGREARSTTSAAAARRRFATS